MVRPLANYDESRFWKRLVGLGTDPRFHGDRTALETLRGNVRQVADHSGYILRQIVRFLPEYSLHDEDHILNVLGLMDALTPDEVMGRLTPLESGGSSWPRTPTTSAWRWGGGVPSHHRPRGPDPGAAALPPIPRPLRRGGPAGRAAE